MSLTMRVLITTLVLCGAASAATVTIDDFNPGVSQWKPEMETGDVANCRAAEGKGPDGSGALKIDYDFRAADTNHIIYARNADLDLSAAEGIEFDVKGSGDKVGLFLFVWDSKGLSNNYGPHGTNIDFHTGHADWHKCKLSFEIDRSIQGGRADLADIKRIGFMINDTGARKGLVVIDNLRIVESEPKVTVMPKAISPNGDGVNDSASVIVDAPKGVRVTVGIYNRRNKLVATLLEDAIPDRRRVSLPWDGSVGGHSLPNGIYEIVATFSGTETIREHTSVVIQSLQKWPTPRHPDEPFFPIGVWFEGDPPSAGYPADAAGAKAYYDRCFADLAAHGFNTVAVPNCPEALWETLLASAETHGTKVVLEVAPLTALVSGAETATEKDAREAVMPVVDKIGKYQSLLRYQVRDEPSVQMIPNWILVQRVLAGFDSRRPAFSCFCSAEALGSLTEKTPVSEAVFDIYPFVASTPAQHLGGFVNSLDAFTRVSKDNVKWAVLQAFTMPGTWRYPSAEEVRAETYLSLAAGVKGIFYFIYQSMPNRPDKMDGLIDPAGKPMPLYGPVSALAAELGRLAPLVLTLKPAEKPIRVEGPVRAGSFVDGGGSPVLIVASEKPGESVTARVSDASPWKDFLTGDTYEPTDGIVTLKLAPGDGRVLVR